MTDNTFYVSRNPECYGPEVTDDEARAMADKIIAKMRERHPGIRFESCPHEDQWNMDVDPEGAIAEDLDENWVDWIV